MGCGCHGAAAVALAGCLARAAAAAPAGSSGLSFITLGDWGGAALKEPEKPYWHNVHSVAAQMNVTALERGVQFVVNTGDNFYWCGIEDTDDFQVAADWLEPFAAASLQVPWYGALGNHEYGYSVEAQLQLSKKHPRWVMDGRYFSRRLPLGGDAHATLVFIDTSPCVREYRSESNDHWDPCGKMYPTCSLSGGHDEFEGRCRFHENIMTQDCGEQFRWFKETLAAVPEDDWLIVVGHHPVDEIDVKDFASALQDYHMIFYDILLSNCMMLCYLL